jgi:peptidoglycan/LPS O-acetylase OafA/YrhL
MKDRIRALDGWRGVAILLVLIDHGAELSHSGLIHKATRVGATGVGIFFALSGFLITTLLLREKKKWGRIDFGKFYLRRVFRILPPVFTYLASLVVLAYLHKLQISRLDLLSCIFLFRNYLVTNYLVTNWGWSLYTGHLWSLMVEEHFYLFWPFLLVFTRGNLKALMGLSLSVAVWRAVSFHYQLFPGVWPPCRTDVRLDSLLWGCILAIMLSDPKWVDFLKRRLSGWIIAALVAIDIVSNVRHGQHDYSWFEPIILALLLVWPVLFPDTLLGRPLETKLLRWIGRISYSLYIWQQFWLLFPTAPKVFPSLQQFPVNIGFAFACAIVSYYMIEQPSIALGRRLIALTDRSAARVPA